jgi:diaminopimelate epimerase
MFDNIPFYKMHGLGNDFVVIDARDKAIHFEPNQIRHIAHRKEGIGCDQLILLEPSKVADLFMRIYNADGSEAGMCGNALRCVGAFVMNQAQKKDCRIELLSGIRDIIHEGEDGIKVNMGKASFDWDKMPLVSEMPTNPLDLEIAGLSKPYAVYVGNPHLVFWVEDVNAIDLEDLGVKLERHPNFPEGINIEIAQILDPHTILMRVWERGVGLTDACGSGACAVAFASYKAHKANKEVVVYMPGGDLKIEIDDKDQIFMMGPAVLSYYGSLILNPDYKNASL